MNKKQSFCAIERTVHTQSLDALENFLGYLAIFKALLMKAADGLACIGCFINTGNARLLWLDILAAAQAPIKALALVEGISHLLTQ